MTDTTPPNTVHTDRRVHIERLDTPADEPNYRIYYPGRGVDAALVGWLSLQPSGTPFAFGDAPAEVEFGGDAAKTVEYVGTVGYTDDGDIRAPGARLSFGRPDE